MSIVICRFCGNEIDLCYGKETNDRLTKNERCFTCDFWNGYFEQSLLPDITASVRIDGEHYVVCDENPPGGMRGFGGRKFTIKFLNGAEITTTNLWHQGKIPLLWRYQLPDNAFFVKG